MSRGKAKPLRPPRHLVAVWDLLSEELRDQLRVVAGYPPDWRPRPEPPPTARQRLKGLTELERIMKLRPGLLAQERDMPDDGEGKE